MVVRREELGRSAASTTTSRLQHDDRDSAHAAADRQLVRGARRAEGPRHRGPSQEPRESCCVCSRIAWSPPAGPQPTQTVSSSRSAVTLTALGPLSPCSGVVGHLRALLQRTVTLAVDAGVMDEQVLVAVIGGDEAKTLVVAEPLHGASWHVELPPRYVRAAARRMLLELRPASACTAFRRSYAPARQHDRSRSPPRCVIDMCRRWGPAAILCVAPPARVRGPRARRAWDLAA